MSFNSVLFVYFFTFFFLAYVIAGRYSLKAQNLLLLIGSYAFYGSWNWNLLPLIIISTSVNYLCSLKIAQSDTLKKKRLFLAVGIFVSLGILAYFKYVNFFTANLIDLLKAMGVSIRFETLEIILPVGISFYTFQTMSYTIDVYQERIEATANFLDFAVFVAYFPQLVAGPIERAAELLPQIQRKRVLTMEQFHEGLNLVVFGLCKKVLIADNLAAIADTVFNKPQQYRGLGVVVGILAFGFQIYCDFSGYSNIARGISKWMGIQLMINFNLPYLSRKPSEFWQRWHISLSSWLRDYLFLPTAYLVMRKLPLKNAKNSEFVSYSVGIFVTMFLGGLWHGASWNFVLWGTFHGLLLILYRGVKFIASRGVLKRNLKKLRRFNWLRPIRAFSAWLLWFGMVNIAWVFFRSPDLKQAGLVFSHIGFSADKLSSDILLPFLLPAGPLFLFQLLQYHKKDLLPTMKLRLPLRLTVYVLIFYIILIYGVSDSVEFIYFQF